MKYGAWTSAGKPPAGASAPASRMTGKVTKIVRARACGFIRTTEGREVFFHASDLEGATFAEVRESHKVRFELVDDRISGPRALRVSRA
jgi:cold shock CspA family protein